jgi:5'-3' exonuclease
MSRGLLLIDGSNIGHAANSATKLVVGDMPTQAIFGVLKTLRPMLATFSMLTPIVLWDGRSWRKDLFKEYKESRDKVAVTKNDEKINEARAEFKRQSPYIKLAIKTLGIRQMSALNWEADDLAGMLVNKTLGRRVVMISGDKDWIQLVRPNVAWLDPMRNEKLTVDSIPKRLGWNPDKKKLSICDGVSMPGFIGVPSARAWLDMKALMGDKSDDIPGVGGIGEKGAIELVSTYGSVTAFMNGCMDRSIDVAALPKKFSDFFEQMERQDNYYRNMHLMDLNTKMRPAPINMVLDAPKLNRPGFKTICNRFYFKSILDRFDDWVEPFGVAA